MGEAKNEVVRQLQDTINELKSIRKKDGSKEQQEQVERKIWQISKDKFKMDITEKIANKVVKHYQGIIFTIGFSKEPIILNILGFNPDHCYFIHSKDSERILNDITEETGLKPTNFQKKMLDKSSAAEAYNAVKEGIKYLIFEKGLREEEIALDPTGGTKAMSVGCGIATNSYNIDLLYVDNTDYDQDLRRPRPGSEQLVNVTNPFRIYYDDKVLDGLKLLQNYSFEAARKYFLDAEGNARNDDIPKILKMIAIGLHLWDLFDHQKAHKNLSDALSFINRYHKLASLKPYLEKWLQYLDKISRASGVVKEEIIDIYFNGKRMLEREQYDNAAMRYYRTIEMINQDILKLAYNLESQHADYSQLTSDFLKVQCKKENKDQIQLLLERYNEIWLQIFEKRGEKNLFKPTSLLPLKIGLMNGLILRLSLKDPDLDFDFLFRIHNAIDTRNNSILAHGTKPTTKTNCEELERICKQIINPVIHKIDFDKNFIFDKTQLAQISERVRREL